ncbi:tetratricopeptide repeat protein [Sulfurimonas sp.]|uniref:tetratricopeptide repeat protein n=1 Tax=Sulfurimonas sp. TaxID=2022749 RepID=UPI002B46E930|nr:tetratricopeptide repeat protein [Sulfurimonas sp.]
MIKYLLFIVVVINSLYASKIINYSEIQNIKKNSFILEQVEGDLTNDGLKDLVIIIANNKEKTSDELEEKRYLYILKNLGNAKYKILVENSDAIPIKNIPQDGLDNHHELFIKDGLLIIGIIYNRAEAISYFYFSIDKNSLVNYKYKEYKCLHEIEEKFKVDENNVFEVSLTQFSSEKVYMMNYKIPSIEGLIREDKIFQKDYKKLLEIYKSKDGGKLQEYIIKNITKHFKQEQICDTNEYMDNYLFLNNKKNTAKTNDIAFFLERTKNYDEAIYLLEKILKKYPNRTVAYINLGDAYWGLKNKEKAKQAYSTYIKQMKEKGKEKKIPKVVLERIK